MTARTEFIRSFQKKPSLGTRESLISRSREANRAFRHVTEAEIAELVQDALTGDDDMQEVLPALACLQSGSLKPFHHRLIDREIVYPGLIYHDADEDCALRFVDLMRTSENRLRSNHLLLCMAWAGNAEVQKAFSRWRESPPAWAADLHVPPHAYADEAGWELTPDGQRRDLFFRTVRPLVKSGDAANSLVGVSVSIPTDETCPWCERLLVSLFDIDTRSETAAFLGLGGKALRVTTCDVCCAFGTIFSKNDGKGGSKWHTANVRPNYLPDPSEWDAFPERPLVLSGERRHFMESASWSMVPGVSFSQMGGLPTWVQDAEYPLCPECSKKMLFVGQISNEDFDQMSEGIEYAFVCRACHVTAVTYQQS